MNYVILLKLLVDGAIGLLNTMIESVISITADTRAKTCYDNSLYSGL